MLFIPTTIWATCSRHWQMAGLWTETHGSGVTHILFQDVFLMVHYFSAAHFAYDYTLECPELNNFYPTHAWADITFFWAKIFYWFFLSYHLICFNQKDAKMLAKKKLHRIKHAFRSSLKLKNIFQAFRITIDKFWNKIWIFLKLNIKPDDRIPFFFLKRRLLNFSQL